MASPRPLPALRQHDTASKTSPRHPPTFGHLAHAKPIPTRSNAQQEGPAVATIPRLQHEARQRTWRRQRRHSEQHPLRLPVASSIASTLPFVEAAAPASQGPPAALPKQPAAAETWLSPKLALLVAAMLWGSYSVSVRLLYSTAEPPDATVVMAVRGLLQGAAMLAISSTMQQVGGAAAGGGHQQQQEAQQQGSLAEQWLMLKSPPLWMAALELGLWNYTATGLQTLGLQLTSATRASFLIQATIMLTPLLSTLAGYRPARRVWAACGLALAGTLLVTADEAGASAMVSGWEAAGLQLGGDSAILASAVFYSLGVVRIAGYTRSLPPGQIAISKSFVLGGLALASLVFVSGSAAAAGRPMGVMWGGVATDPLSWAALLWSGLGPGALASYLHAQGQKHVPPAQAQIIFSSKPLWSVGLAWVLLGSEELGPLTWMGGAILMAAGLLASSSSNKQQQRQGQEQFQPIAQPVLTQQRERRKG